MNYSCRAVLALLFAGVSLARGQFVPAPTNVPAPPFQLPPSVPDPLEPANRAIWDFNVAVLKDVVQPTAKVYRKVVVKPVRQGLANMGRNAVWPDRALNNLLQEKWTGARDETYRFLINSTLGVAGFFDVASNWWNIHKSDADFGQTFGLWGWHPGAFLMLPFVGPSNDRDLIGLTADSTAAPAAYFSPYGFHFSQPLTWLTPWNYFLAVVAYNNLSDTVDENVRFAESEPDPYAELEYLWTFARNPHGPDFQVHGPTDAPALETLRAVLFTVQNHEFLGHGKTRSVVIPTTGRKLKFSYWLQPGVAPVVYIVPGLGSHRLSEATVALAELLYNHGFTAVCVSSPFHPEFMDAASTVNLPAYLPVDGKDLQTALTAIDGRMTKMYPGRLAARALMGYSMGAFETLYLAADSTNDVSPFLKFDRYVAIDTPVRLLHGVQQIDTYFNAPLGWPESVRATNLANALMKVEALSQAKLSGDTPLPFEGIEAKFLIGMNFRFVLRDIIYDSQRKNDQGILREPLHTKRREPTYDEIIAYSYEDYFHKFAVPYYTQWGLRSAEKTLDHADDLRSYESGIKGNDKTRVIVNQDDFLSTDDDRAWLRGTFGNHLTEFPHGGHLGNLIQTNVQSAIVESLNGLGLSR